MTWGSDHTGNPKVEIARARDEARGGDLEAALARVDRVLREHPRQTDALGLQHLLRLRLSWMCGAFEPIATLLEVRSDEGDIRRLLRQHVLSMSCDEAIALLERLPARGEAHDFERMEIFIECRRFESASAVAAPYLERTGLATATLTRLARLCVEAGDGPLACEFARRAARESPGDAQALALAGTMALWSGDLEKAAAFAARALAVDPQAGEPRRLEGQVALLRGEIGESLRHFQAALDAAGADKETLVLLGEAHRRLGNVDDARSCLQRASALGGPYSLAWQMNELLTGIRPAERSRKPMTNSLDLLEGLSALGLIPRSWDGSPKPSLLYHDLERVAEEGLARLSGNRSATLTRPGPAPGTFRCVRRGPNVRTACIRVRDLLKSGGFDAAIAAHETLLVEFGRSPLVYTHRGELYLWAGRYAEARDDFQMALELDRSTRWAWVGLGATELIRRRPLRALLALGRARVDHVASRTTSTDVYRGEALRMVGFRRRALEAFETARRLQPERASVHVNLALEYAFRREGARARESLDTVRQIAPGFYRALLRETSTEEDRLKTDLERTIEVTGHGLRMMRGNRAWGFVTWFDRHGRAYSEQGGFSKDSDWQW
jgi:tetratricopeptide (TPR) repeat protein